MIFCFICECGGVTSLMRKILRSAGHDNWLEEPLYKGKARYNEFYNNLPKEYKDRLEIGALNQHLANTSSYAVVLGIKNDKIIWADAKAGDIKSRLDVELIIQKFAEKE